MSPTAVAECDRVPRVLIADDHLMVAEGLERLLLECFELCSVASDGRQLVEMVLAEQPDVVIADIGMPGLSGIEAMRTLREAGIFTPFVFLTMHAEATLAIEALRQGGSAYVLNSAAGEELIRAVRTVLAGETYVSPGLGARLVARRAQSVPSAHLTDKQLQVLSLVATGLRSKQVAHELGISIRTVESHKYAIMQALDVHCTVELVRKAEQTGLLPAKVET